MSADTGLVVQDCLQICCNILQEEPCQRFFFGMGSDWPLRLAYFFDPALLEASVRIISVVLCCVVSSYDYRASYVFYAYVINHLPSLSCIAHIVDK